jgi:hypothetical protein
VAIAIQRLPFIGVVNVLERNVLFVFEETVELGMMSVEPELGEEERGVGLDQRSVALDTIADCPTTSL